MPFEIAESQKEQADALASSHGPVLVESQKPSMFFVDNRALFDDLS